MVSIARDCSIVNVAEGCYFSLVKDLTYLTGIHVQITQDTHGEGTGRGFAVGSHVQSSRRGDLDSGERKGGALSQEGQDHEGCHTRSHGV